MKTAAASPTIRDLASALGVSHTTVSLALRNHASISVATRKRVQAAARRAGYKSNVLVRALLGQVRRGRLPVGGETIAFLTALPVHEWCALPSVTAGLADGGGRAGGLGLRIEPFFVGRAGEASAQVNRVLESRGVRGVILPPLPLTLEPLRIRWDRFALVAIGYSFHQANPHRVVNAHFNGMVSCYARLRAAGRKRIGLVLPRDEDEKARHYWLSGFMAAPIIQGGAKLSPLLMESRWDEKAMGEWFERQRPDAIIGMSRDALLDWLESRGVRVPEDVSYACLDVFDIKGRNLSGIRQAWGAIFSHAIELIGEQLARNELGIPASSRVTMIDGVWRDGATVSAANRAW